MASINTTSSSSGIKTDWVLFAQVINRALCIPEKTVEDFLAFIGCHSSLRALTAIANNLTVILPIVEQLTDDHRLKAESLPCWLKICDYVIENTALLSAEFSEINQQSSNGKRAPFPRQFEQYPLYTSLWYHHPVIDYQNRYGLLQAVLLLCHFEFRNLEQSDEKDYTSPTQQSARAIRQCAEMTHPEKVRELTTLIKSLPEKVTTLSEYLNFIYALEEDEAFHEDSLRHPLEVLRRMVRYAVEHRGGYNRKYNRVWEAILNREATREIIVASEAGDAYSAAFSVESISMFSQTEKEEEKAKSAGCAPGEVKAGVEHIIVQDEGETRSPMAGRSPIAHLRRTRDKHKNIAMANQLLAGRWECLTSHEVTIFLHEVSNLVRDRSVKSLYSDRIGNLELAALLTALYWSGAGLDTVIMAKFADRRTDVSSKLDANDLRYVDHSEEWMHGSLRPSYKSNLEQETKDFVYDTYTNVVLPIENHHSGIMRRWLWRIADERKKIRCKRLFYLEKTLNHAKPHYESAIKAFLTKLNRQYKTRLTLIRVENDLMNRLYHYSGDLTEAMIITGRNHYLGNVQLHYSSPSLARLQSVYKTTCQQITESVYQPLNRPMPEPSTNDRQLTTEKAAARYTGGRHYLRYGIVANLVEDLVARFSDCLKFSGYLDYWVELHNDYTLYVTEMLGFATGYRAVRNPLECLYQIDWHSGFCCISDKDDMDYYNARLVWLPEAVRQQLQDYQIHCQCLGERLILINPKLARKLLTHGENLDYSVPFLFLMKPNGRLLKLTPQEIKKQLSDIFKVPCNVNRSYLRNRLRELGCSGEIVNDFLGHWENGEEPFGLYATLSPSEYRAEIAPRLTQLLEEDGWRCIQGFGRSLPQDVNR
ncbi:hypothetical protein [Methylotuvimicrobium sp. KM2]|uniref:hypothetical protein n=1 Tax=Methylotuvimicrobium sp. KM2 TaxID=3133976 RepID=UPI003101A811